MERVGGWGGGTVGGPPQNHSHAPSMRPEVAAEASHISIGGHFEKKRAHRVQRDRGNKFELTKMGRGPNVVDSEDHKSCR